MRGQGLISQPVGRVVGVPFPEAQALHEVLIQRAIPGHQMVGPGHDGQVGLIAGPQVQEIAHEDPAGEERFCKPIVYIEGRSVRILCRSYGIHFWMLEAAPDDEPAQLLWMVGDMFWRPRAPEQARILPGLQA